ncbi:hypothetical protein [Paraburkholderia sp. BL27I4N3]|uniref:hypothetical protein n=1 Tax=Paraburkholderia sp. BL27I4N3 TaxID=1938805 RepID=UPI000E240A5E|nr:hypothetical protein [Paraburkholderia sp. BL27I4N3]
MVHAFHLGTIIRTMFASFFTFDAGFGEGALSVFSDADLALGEIAQSAYPEGPWSLESHAVQPTARLLQLYDDQLKTAPRSELMAAHQRAQRNFKASVRDRLSIGELMQRSRRRARDSSQMDTLSHR